LATPHTRLDPSVYDNPIWPDRLPRTNALRLLYGEFADELVVLFDEKRHQDPVYVLIATPDYDYAAIKVDGATGEVVGVMVYPLAAYAVERHPAWQAATEPNPDPAVAARIVSDIKDLFDRYGIETGSDERG
jgi:hypothetical protein